MPEKTENIKFRPNSKLGAHISTNNTIKNGQKI